MGRGQSTALQRVLPCAVALSRCHSRQPAPDKWEAGRTPALQRNEALLTASAHFQAGRPRARSRTVAAREGRGASTQSEGNK